MKTLRFIWILSNIYFVYSKLQKSINIMNKRLIFVTSFYLLSQLLISCYDKCNSQDSLPLYGSLSLFYQKGDRQPYFPVNTANPILPQELTGLIVTDENKKQYSISYPEVNGSYSIRINNFLGFEEYKALKDGLILNKVFYMKFNDNNAPDTLQTQITFKNDECNHSFIQDFTALNHNNSITPINKDWYNDIILIVKK